MGKIYLFTPEQKIIFDQISTSKYIRSNFYFTGGTALSYYYLHHRYSEDLDFFSEDKLDTQALLLLMQEWSHTYNFSFTQVFREVVYIFNLVFENGSELKVDFGHYPHRRVRPELSYQGLAIDSLLDIAINKLLTVNQRTKVKDFVDLYFLLKEFTLWDLIEGQRVKFRVKTDPFILSGDFLKVESFTEMPRMIKPLTLIQLQTYFRKLAVSLGKKAVI